MGTPENPRVRRFRFLTEAEFNALTAEEKMAYLRAAMRERQRLSGSVPTEPDKDKLAGT